MISYLPQGLALRLARGLDVLLLLSLSENVVALVWSHGGRVSVKVLAWRLSHVLNYDVRVFVA